MVEDYQHDAHGERVKQIRLLLNRKRPLHVYEVHHGREEVVFITDPQGGEQPLRGREARGLPAGLIRRHRRA